MSRTAGEPPTLVLFTGLPCTGKSTLAEGAAGILNAAVLGWDWAMAGLTWCEPVQLALQSLSRADHRRIGWSLLSNMAEAQLRHGRSVVLDGVARAEHVAVVRDLAQRYGARSLVVLVSCTDRARLGGRVEQRRRAIPGWHELTWDHVESYRWQPPVDVDYTIDTADNPDPHEFARRLLGRSHPAGGRRRIGVEPLLLGSEVIVRRAKLAKDDVVYPMIVESDDGDHVVVAGPYSGSVSRDLGYVRFDPEDRFVEHFWRSRWYSVADVQDPIRGRKGWYCDVTRPAVVAPGSIVSADLELDLWVPAETGPVLILDEDEFEASGLSRSDPIAAAHARQALQELRDAAQDRFRELLP